VTTFTIIAVAIGGAYVGWLVRGGIDKARKHLGKSEDEA